MLLAFSRAVAYLVSGITGFIGVIAFMGGGPIGFVFIFVGPWIAIVVHELGHAFAAHAMGMRVRTIVAGPIALNMSPLRFAGADALLGHDVGGYVLYDERPGGRYLTRNADILIAAAGPLANLAFAVVAYILTLALVQRELLAQILIGLAFASFAAFIISALPFKTQGGRPNDALEILRAIRSGTPKRRANVGPPKRSPWQAP